MEVAGSPLIHRIRGATIAALDLDVTAAWYGEWLGYEVRESGTVSPALALSWRASGLTGRSYLLMSSPGAPDVHIRAVQSDPCPGYRALTSWGWNSIEIVVDDVAALNEKLSRGPFEILDEAHPLKGLPSIVAMQVRGPSEEVLYLTMESGDRDDSVLPYPNAFVGRPFIAVLAGPDLETMLDWYGKAFAMARRPIGSSPIGLIQRAQGMPETHEYPLTTMKLAEHGNLIEFDAYPPSVGERPRVADQLPPGNALYSFAVRDLDAFDLPFHTAPALYDGAAYAGGRAATLTGPAGELIELVEERPA